MHSKFRPRVWFSLIQNGASDCFLEQGGVVSACLAMGINDRGEIACVGRVASVPLPKIARRTGQR